MHAERKYSVCSHQHSFTPYPSLSPYSQTDRITDRGMNTLAARGLEDFFFQLYCCVSFLVVVGNSFRCYLPTIPVVPLCIFFIVAGNSFWVALISYLVVAGNSFRCYLLIYHTSCAILSVFLLRRKIVFGCTVSKKDFYSVSLIERNSASKCVYFVRSNTLLLCISLLCIYLLYHTDPQIHRLDCFLKFPELSGEVGISRIPSKNTDRKITNLSGKHSFTQSVS